MDIMDRAIDRSHPKVRPLAQALLAAALAQGATVEDFELASNRILTEAKGKLLLLGLADLVSDI